MRTEVLRRAENTELQSTRFLSHGTGQFLASCDSIVTLCGLDVLCYIVMLKSEHE